MLKHLRRGAGLAVAVVAVSAGLGMHAFTASNTVAASKAGVGAGAISGYAVSNIAYTNASGDITGVSFNLDGAAADVKVTLVDAGTEFDCGGSVGVADLVTCTVSVPASVANDLTVVANQ
jgi:hypothetical protein